MTKEEEEEKFKALRHRFYKLGFLGPKILMGKMGRSATPISKDEIRDLLSEFFDNGRVQELETFIGEAENERKL